MVDLLLSLESGLHEAVLLFLLPLFLTVGCRSKTYEISRQVRPLSIGTRTVELVVYEAGADGLTYVLLHEDEKTASQAVMDVIEREGGRFVKLEHVGERDVTFRLGDGADEDTAFTFDPNRMFSDAGIRSSLAAHGPVTPEAREAVQGFAEAVLQVVSPQETPVVVAVHNNRREEDLGEGERNYSTLSYMDGGWLAPEALFVYRNDAADPDDFFYVTNRTLYDRIRQGEFNVVLQNNRAATDDGSLSIYCARHDIPYVNVEAQRGHYEYQVKMLECLNSILENGIGRAV